MNGELVYGFSRLSKEEKIKCISSFIHDEGFIREANSFSHPHQELFDSFSENTLTNYILPFGIAPNFLINGKICHVPMVTEESSVVAAASAAAKFWYKRGGFHSEVISAIKKGHVHFLWFGSKEWLTDLFPVIKEKIIAGTLPLTVRMRERGGGIVAISLEDFTDKLEGYFRLALDFETADSMGANFINTVLESTAGILKDYIREHCIEQSRFEIVMSILSNHVPECLVECTVSCRVSELDKVDGETPAAVYAGRFKRAVDIACIDPFRAATHNKGIMNGVDAVVIATGNDFRAIEAGAHAYASINGTYKSLSTVQVTGDIFSFSLRMPLAVGAVGGLTALHPMAKRALQILGNPGARELMTIIASVGLANNYSAVKALVTSGIQKGHMKMHLSNMLIPYNLNPDQKRKVEEHFSSQQISFAAVSDYINNVILS